eukprot:TRINITY_DN16594_c0_g3_i1.p1 TRINITY_DN16594_c0_g3~~TRINITY_DN16594_c0_g3_i1.p1  ORF type:complete len:259 (-),score=21.96 TRINITY_DN16594_c0_g3_i1:44-820(-)
MCRKLNVSKAEFRKALITYDYSGRLLFSVKAKERSLLSYPHKLSFSVEHDRKIKEQDSIEANKSKFKELLYNLNEDDIQEASNMKIKPTYGVKYSCGQEVFSGLTYSKHPDYKGSHISIKEYNELCGTRKSAQPASNNSIIKKHEDTNVYLLKSKIQDKLYTQASPYKVQGETKRNATAKYYSHKTQTAASKKRNLKGGSCSYYELSSDEPSVRSSLRMPMRYSYGSNKRSRSVLGSAKKYKLPPPPLGCSVGHGLFR